jgi:glutaredoxin 3
VSNVVVFGTTNCLWCRQATKYFGENRVPFQEVGVERDPAAARDLLWRKTGPTVVPVIQIGASPTSASTSPPSARAGAQGRMNLGEYGSARKMRRAADRVPPYGRAVRYRGRLRRRGYGFSWVRHPPLTASKISCAASTTKISTEAPRIMLDRSPLRYSRPTRRFRSHIRVIARNGMNKAPREA